MTTPIPELRRSRTESIAVAEAPYVLSLDEGTTSARAALYNERGERIAMHSVAFDCFYPHPGWVEQDAVAIWNAQLSAARTVLEQAGGCGGFGKGNFSELFKSIEDYERTLDV